MVIILVKKYNSIDKALKVYRNRIIKIKQLETLNDNRNFVKKSVKKRNKKNKAIYLQKKK